MDYTMEDKEPTELTLEALDDEEQADSGSCGKAKFQIDSRDNKEGDRRKRAIGAALSDFRTTGGQASLAEPRLINGTIPTPISSVFEFG